MGTSHDGSYTVRGLRNIRSGEFQHDQLKGLQFYRGADKSLDRPTSRCILFDGENISFDPSLVIYM
jgi:hypothetical protein